MLNNHEYFAVNLVLSGFAFLMMALIFAGMEQGVSMKKKQSQKSYRLAVLSLLFGFLFSFGSFFFYSRAEYAILYMVLASLHYACSGLWLFFLFQYVVSLLEERDYIVGDLKTVNRIILVIGSVVYLIPYVGAYILGIYDNGTMVRGSFYLIRIGLCLLTFVLSGIIFFQSRSVLRNPDIAILLFCYAVPAVFSLLPLEYNLLFLLLQVVAFYLLHIYIHSKYAQLGLANEMSRADECAQLANAKMQLLQNQLNPDFLKASLDEIANLCKTDPEKAKENIQNFNSYFEMNKKFSNEDELVTFRMEMEYLFQYFRLLQLSRSYELHLSVDIKAQTFRLPSMTMQMLIYYLVSIYEQNETNIHLLVTSKEVQDGYEILIENMKSKFGGAKMNFDEALNNDFALVKKRVQTLVGGKIVFLQEKGTSIKMTIPFETFDEK